ncbi:MAG: hypothetical protein ABSG43_15305 [Solirubrobacteraceae bacterium]
MSAPLPTSPQPSPSSPGRERGREAMRRWSLFPVDPSRLWATDEPASERQPAARRPSWGIVLSQIATFEQRA